MKNALQIATFAGIPIRIHWSFWLLFVWIAFEGRRVGMDWEGVGWFGLLIVSLFGCVVLHEYGHALSARRYGVNTKDIILSPIGGIARLDSLPEKPIHEFLVAIAGPMVNVVIAIILGTIGWMSSTLDLDMGGSRAIFGDPDNFLSSLFALNIFVAIFNLVPAFPMDGGRIFRSLLSIKLGRRKATRIAAWFGQAIALGFIISAYFVNPMFIFIGIFVFYMATQEYRMVKYEETLKNFKVSEIMRSQFTFFQKNQNIAFAIDEVKRGLEKDFIVVDASEKPIGVIHEFNILKAAKKKDALATIDDYMIDEIDQTSPDDTLKIFYHKLQQKRINILPVYENEILVGVLDIRQLNDFLALQQKLK